MRKILFLVNLCAVVALITYVYAGTITKPNTFSTGQTITADSFNDNFDTIYNEFNGSIEAANIAANAVGASELNNTDDFTMGTLTVGDITSSGDISCTTMTATSNIVLNSTGKFYVDGGSNTYIIEDSADQMAFYAAGEYVMAVISSGTWINGGKKLFLDGGTNTYITEPLPDTISFVLGGTEALKLETTLVSLGSSAELSIEPTKKLYLDGGSDTYIFEQSANDIQIYVGGSVNAEFQSGGNIFSNAPLIVAEQDLIPSVDDSANSTLGDGTYHWYGLWYGAGGLNQKACFKDYNKKDVTFRQPTSMYGTLPNFGDFHHENEDSEDPLHTGFIINASSTTYQNYEYISLTNDQLSFNLTTLIAQMSECIKDLNDRVEDLETRVLALEAE